MERAAAQDGDIIETELILASDHRGVIASGEE
jgi:hypothetical protein